MFDSQGPGKAVSRGPLQVVFFQQSWATTVPMRRTNALFRESKFMIAIMKCYSRSSLKENEACLPQTLGEAAGIYVP